MKPEPTKLDEGFTASNDGFTRRALLVWTAMLSAFGIMAMVLYPLLKFVMPTASAKGGSERDFVELKELPEPGTSLKFRYGRYPAILVNYEGRYYAYGAICTHLACVVHYEPDGCQMPHPNSEIHCVCHGGHYDVETAEVVGGPPPIPLAKLKIKELDGKILVLGWESESYVKSLSTYA